MESTTVEIINSDSTPAVLRHLAATAVDQAASASVTTTADTQRIFRAAQGSAEFFDHLQAHYRESRRTMVEIACDIKLTLADGTLFDSGTGVLLNVSPSGALLGRLKLEKGCLPVQAFRISLALKRDEYNGVRIEAKPVRLAPEVSGLGVKFEEISVAA